MGKNKPGVPDGTGPAKGSYQEQTVGVGKRVASGQICPRQTKEETKKE